MRRLFLLLLFGLSLIGAVAPMQAAPVHGPSGMGMPGHCGDDRVAGCAHECLGCALAPAEPFDLACWAPCADCAPIAFAPIALHTARLGHDPPPPRRG